jgi:hypothetical protein
LSPALDPGVEKWIQIVIFAPSLSEFRPSGIARLDARQFWGRLSRPLERIFAKRRSICFFERSKRPSWKRH